MSAPTVSVVIPVHNRPEAVDRAVSSILAQGAGDKRIREILVVDDGSSRPPPADLAAKDPRILIHRQEQQGPAGARNTGVRLAAGELVAFCDSDDVWLEGKLETQLVHFDADPSLVVAGGGADYRTPDGTLVKRFRPRVRGSVAEAMLYRNLFVTSTVVARRDVLAAMPECFKTDLAFNEDWELWIRLAARGPARVMEDCRTVYAVSAAGFHGVQSLDTLEKAFHDMYAALQADEAAATLLRGREGRIGAIVDMLMAYELFGRGRGWQARRRLLRAMARAPEALSWRSALPMLLLPRAARDGLRKRLGGGS